MLIMDVKGAFSHIIRNGLMRKIKALRANRDLVRWRASFMSERRVKLRVDDKQCKEAEVEKRVSQGSLISPILFVIYFSEIFSEVEEEVKLYIATTFADDCVWLVLSDSVAKQCNRLERDGMKIVEWRRTTLSHSTTQKTR